MRISNGVWDVKKHADATLQEQSGVYQRTEHVYVAVAGTELTAQLMLMNVCQVARVVITPTQHVLTHLVHTVVHVRLDSLSLTNYVWVSS